MWHCNLPNNPLRRLSVSFAQIPNDPRIYHLTGTYLALTQFHRFHLRSHYRDPIHIPLHLLLFSFRFPSYNNLSPENSIHREPFTWKRKIYFISDYLANLRHSRIELSILHSNQPSVWRLSQEYVRVSITDFYPLLAGAAPHGAAWVI